MVERAEDKNIEPDQELGLDVEGHSVEEENGDANGNFNVGCCV